MGGRGRLGISGSQEFKETEPTPTDQQKFEYDPAKSVSNKEKHGIDFEDAKKLWNDDKRTMTQVPYASEERFLVTGRIDSKLWTAVVTMRNDSIRIISTRRARDKEVTNYEQDYN